MRRAFHLEWQPLEPCLSPSVQQPRYAIYYVPDANSALYRFGAELLGYDAFTGKTCAQPADMLRRFADWHDLTQDPRKYGFHATLKAPFVLEPMARETDVVAALRSLVAKPRSIPSFTPRVAVLSGFIAIIPELAPDALGRLASDCVKHFEPLRAPMTDEERKRRLKSKLTPRQIAQVDSWGYPYVFEDFRFHMTLTGRVAPDIRDDVLAHLRQRFAELNMKQLPIDAIAVFRQLSPDRPFEIIARSELSAG